MQEIPRKIVLLLLFFSLILPPSTQNPQEEIYYCGNTLISNPSELITCRSGKLYFKSSTGLFHVSGTEEVKLRARVSMEVEGHIPDLCIACERPKGNCGVALRCLCHPKECKNKVINFGTKSRALSGNLQQLLPLLLLLAMFLICF
ncbi:hypothetical protein AT3G44716 [Arabidopsis thaliana]|jgi:hypothetical protein|uniref:Uncharacterized protein n=1 Tax=Arabidopsis thaliana TaxID=3702 RepID=Q3EAQ0_ARATH|nr:uncharacterized protein AT3G44716 [Arabidopsis thaliana]AEE77936.1 hypothetical protein AT3G44716 [Arabidopsis thaliana]|eukprot:NP_683681.2 hypothetical protein AT3G44716 [Arabidopsis thaliana]